MKKIKFFTLRMDEVIHTHIKKIAAQNIISMKRFVLEAIAYYITKNHEHFKSKLKNINEEDSKEILEAIFKFIEEDGA